LHFGQRKSVYRYIKTSFRILAALLPLEIAAGAPAIPSRANQNRGSNTQLYKNLATRPNIFVRSLVNTGSNPA
jgi:hypothetical protein